jgi:hypothetical protein
MKITSLLVALLVTMTFPAHSQIIGIFEQGAEELKEYGQQIAALELLLTGQRKGYHIIESGLSSIGSITGGEFTLHQNYYAGLGAVNPAIALTPKSTGFLSIESQTLNALTAALNRWRQSQYLTSTDLAYVTRVSSFIASTATLRLSTFNALTSNNNLTMTDDQRVGIISQLYIQIQSLYVYLQTFIDSVDFLILNREN